MRKFEGPIPHGGSFALLRRAIISRTRRILLDYARAVKFVAIP